MERESLTFDSENSRLVVRLNDGTERVYSDRASYLADWPDRGADCDAMGW